MNETPELIDETKIPLKRVLGVTTAILLVAGNMIGTGVFKKIVPMAATGLTENYILCAWILAGLITLFGAFTISGLAQMTTESGGAYEYLRLCFGKFVSFSFGWAMFIIIGSGSIAAVAFIFAQSVNSLIAIPQPLHFWKDISIGNFIYPFADSGIKIFAIVVIASLTWINYFGVKKGTHLNTVLTWAKILGIVLLIFLGLFINNAPTANNSILPNTIPLSGTAFFTAFFGAMLGAFWAYDGFANVASITGEIKNPKRNVPIAVIAGVSIVMILYTLINYAFMKSMPLQQLASISPDKIAANIMAGNIMGKTGTLLISLLIIISSFGTLNVIIILYSRMYYRMAQENMFFKNAQKVHPVYNTPYIALIYTSAWSIILVISGTFDMLTNMVIFADFVFYSSLAIGLIKMKRKNIIRYKIPGYPASPLLFIVFVVALLINTVLSQPKQALTGLALLLSCVPFYYYFKRKEKREG